MLPDEEKLIKRGLSRRPLAIVAGWLAFVAVLGPFGTQLPGAVNDEYEVPAGSQTGRVQRLLQERFPGGDRRPILIVYRRDGGLTGADLARIAADARRAAAIPDLGAPLAPFAPSSAGLVSPAGDVAVTIVPLVAGEVLHVREAVGRLRELRDGVPGLEVHVTGFPALVADVNTVIREADLRLLAMTATLVLLILVAVYRSPLLAVVPLLVVGLAYAAATGIVYVANRAGLPVDSTSTSLLLVLMFGAGTDYCLLFASRYRAALRTHEQAADAVRAALRDAGPAIVASGATVVVALLTTLAGAFGVVRTLGPVNAIGVGLVVLASLTLLPALLGLLGRRAFWPGVASVAHGSSAVVEGRTGPWERAGTAVRKAPWRWLGLATALLVAGSFGLLAHHSDMSVTAQFRSPTDGTRGYGIVASAFPPGVSNPTTVLVERTAGPVRGSDVAAVTRIVGAVGGVASVVDTGRRSRDGRIAELTSIFADDPFSDRALERVQEIRERVAHAGGAGVEVLVGGGSGERLDYREAGARDLRTVGPLVLLVVLLSLMALLRALAAPLFLLGTVVLSFLGSFGASLLAYRLLFGQEGIDPAIPIIVLIFLVALGSDYNIFLMARVRREAAEHGTDGAMLRGLVATGPVITSAGLVLAGTFSLLLVLPHYPLMDIGFAVALGVLVDTFVVRSVCVPAIVWLLGERSWWPSREAASPGVPNPAPRL